MPPAPQDSTPASDSAGPRLALLHGLNFLGVGIYLPFFPIWLASRHLDDAAIGLVLTVPILVRMLTVSTLAGLGDGRLAPGRLLAAMNGVAALLYLLLLQADGLWPITLLLGLSAVAIAGVVPVTDALTTAQVRTGAPIDYGRVRVWGSITFIAANLSGGALLAVTGAEAVPIALAGCAMLAAIAGLAAPSAPLARRSMAVGGASPGRFSLNFWLVVAAAACVNATHAALYAFGSLHWRSQGLSEPVIGALWGVGVAAEIGLFLVGGSIVARGAAGVNWIAISAVAAIIRFALMALDPGLLPTLLLQMLHGVTFGCTHLGAMAAISALAPEARRNAAQGRFVALGALASGAMTLLSGHVYQRYGASVFLAMTPLAGLGLALALLANRRLRGNTGRRGQ